MHSRQTYLIVLVLLITGIQIAITAEIIEFSAILLSTLLISNDSITLNVRLSNCSSVCPCHVQKNKTGPFLPVNYLSNNSIGTVRFDSLQPYTLYSFEINCSEVLNTKTYAIRTDVFRPSPPRDIEIKLNNLRLQLKWTPPAFPHGPITEYRVTVDGNQTTPTLQNTQFTYEMKTDYIPNTTHIMSVSACNNDTQMRMLCSNPKDAEVSFFQNEINNSSIIIPTQSASIHQISLIFILFIEILLAI